MKNRFSIIMAAALLTVTLPAAADWEPRGMCYVWSGATPPEKAPTDMLEGKIYDYNRNPQGEFFTYSGIYSNDNEPAPGRSLKAALKERSTGARNPTGSPDVHGQFAYTLRELMNGRYGILNKYYKYPFTIATPHIYMAPTRFSSLDDALEVSQEDAESDFLTESDAFQKKTGKAKSFQDHVSWFAVFRGTVIAPRSMKFRFYGAADDSIAVRFNEKLVLETGYCKPALYQGNGIRDKGCNWEKDFTRAYQKEVAQGMHADKRDYVVRKLKSTPYCNSAFNGVTGGTPIKVTEGKAYPIEIIIGNNGGKALFYLLTQEVTPGNNAPLHLFRTNADEPSRPRYRDSSYGEDGPDFADDSDIWKVVANSGKPKKKKKKK